MVKRIDQWISKSMPRRSLPLRAAVLCLLYACLSPSFSEAAPRKGPAPRAHISGVERSFVNQGVTPVSGAGLHFFQNPESEASGTERFDIRWYANPPGIPPGAIVMLETIQARSSRVKNHMLRTQRKSEGNIQSIIEISPEEIRQAGRPTQWRVRIIWRGRSLASRTSANWES